MYFKEERIYKTWDLFYKQWQIFKWHLRKTIIDWRREYAKTYYYKYSHPAKSPKRTFKDDYNAFKERRGFQDIYVSISWCYDRETNMWEFQVIVPVYKLEDWKIKTIYTETRWRYPLWILECTPVEHLPREEWSTIEPGESYKDSIDKYWRDADMFVALSWQHAVRKLNPNINEHNSERIESANITWAWFPIVNDYNRGYKYIDWKLYEMTEKDMTPEEHLTEVLNS